MEKTEGIKNLWKNKDAEGGEIDGNIQLINELEGQYIYKWELNGWVYLLTNLSCFCLDNHLFLTRSLF